MTISLSHLIPGQRWISETEPELGLGILISHDKRTLKIEFPAGECTRQYSLSSAPVRRMVYKTGDRIAGKDGRKIEVEAVEEAGGIFTYIQGNTRLSEPDLAASLAVDLPLSRLTAGLSGPFSLFDLRMGIRKAQADYQASPAKGFMGGQVDLIPHQLYIAGQVCNRYFPRVMLSDETGLGKTIEAGLVLHRLMVLEQIHRVLIIVPDALVHQWFIELYRKFNLKFRIFNQDYCLGDGDTNPFTGDQQGICTLSLVQDHPQIQEAIINAGWDMVVMDEAHHLTDDAGFHGFMKVLSRETRGLILLTATPEQAGLETHFAQLRLLDPDRYYDLDAYVKEAKGYESTALEVKDRLAKGKPVEQLVDTFGPGRVVFRNRREVIKGFPKRKVAKVPLSGTAKEIRAVNQITGREAGVPDLVQDPRVKHLAELSKRLKPEKILVICRSKEIAQGIVQGVQAHIAVDAARFDETMSLIERDRQAAWFAREEGARLLVCSEIGSEGRNFQFARHLYLFDLPLNPELLEQRIGRVDRIGQKNEIVIHLPYVKDSCQEILVHWADQGLGILEQNINGLHSIFRRFESQLRHLMAGATKELTIDREGLADLVAKTRDHTLATTAELDQGRHILLELNSFKPGPAEKLIQAVLETEQAQRLADFMEILLDHYGVDMETVDTASGDRLVTLSSDRQADEQFPGLPGGGAPLTFDRATAVAREEVEFLTRDHPFVNQVLDFFITQGEGISATALWEGAHGSGLMLESLFLLEVPEIDSHPAARQFIQARPIYICLDHEAEPVLGENRPSKELLVPDTPNWFGEFPEMGRLLTLLVEKSTALAEQEAHKMREKSLKAIEQNLGREIQRLKALKKRNPGIKEGEIYRAEDELALLKEKLSRARIRLDGLRLVRLMP